MIANYVVSDAVSMAASFRSYWINVRTFPNFALHYWTTGTFVAATVTGSGGAFATLANGETAVLGADDGDNFTVTFVTGDDTLAEAITRINAAAGFTFASAATGELKLTGRRTDDRAQVRVVSGTALTKLGLTVANTAGSSASAATGTISFEVSCEDNAHFSTSSGTDITSAVVDNPVALTTTIAITSGSPGRGIVNFVDAGWKWIRLVYTATSGTGTLSARLNNKAGIP